MMQVGEESRLHLLITRASAFPPDLGVNEGSCMLLINQQIAYLEIAGYLEFRILTVPMMTSERLTA